VGVLEQRAEENFTMKEKQVAEEWRNLHNEELHNLYSSSKSDYITKVAGDRRSVVDKQSIAASCLVSRGRFFLNCLFKA
jgi:hypothetical protein